MSGFILTAILSCISFSLIERKNEREYLNSEPIWPKRSTLISLLISYLGISCFYFFSIFGNDITAGHSNEFPINNLNGDHLLYVHIGINLSDGYDENYFPIYTRLEPGKYGNTMYHYAEAWFSAGIHDLTGFPPLPALEVFHMAWFLFLLLLGIFCVIGRHSIISIDKILLGTILLLSGVFYYLYNSFSEEYNAGIFLKALYARPSAFFAKSVYLGPIFIALIILFNNGYKLTATAISTGMIFLSGGLIAWSLSFLFLSIFRMGRGSNRMVSIGFLIVAIISSFLFYYTFYLRTGRPIQKEIAINQEKRESKSEELYNKDPVRIYNDIVSGSTSPGIQSTIIRGVKKVFNHFAQLTISMTLPILILFFLSLGLDRKGISRIRLSNSTLFVIMIVVLGILLSALLANFIQGDAGQFLALTYSIIYVILVLKILHFYSLTSNFILKSLALLLPLIELHSSFLFHYSDDRQISGKLGRKRAKVSVDFIHSVSNQTKNNKVGGFIQDTSRLRVRNSAFARNYRIYYLHELQTLDDYQGFVSIYDDDVPWDPKDPLQDFVKESLFYLNYKKRPENAGLSKEEIRLKFLREYKIDWIVTDPNMELPPYLKKYRTKEICDANTGFCIHYLNLTELLNES